MTKTWAIRTGGIPAPPVTPRRSRPAVGNKAKQWGPDLKPSPTRYVQTQKRYFHPRAAARTHALHARLADATGRPLPARVQPNARACRQFSRPVQEPRSRDRGNAAAARAL